MTACKKHSTTALGFGEAFHAEDHIGDVHLENIVTKLPNFAYVDPAFFDAVDARESDGDLPKPGIRHRASIDASVRENKPLRDYDPSCDQLECYNELAQIIETDGVDR